MQKSLVFGLVHLATSFTVGYALTGSVSVAGAITLIEPAVNTVVHYFFDKAWDRRHTNSKRLGFASTHSLVDSASARDQRVRISSRAIQRSA